MSKVICEYFKYGKCNHETPENSACFDCANNGKCVLLCICEEETCNIGELVEETKDE